MQRHHTYKIAVSSYSKSTSKSKSAKGDYSKKKENNFFSNFHQLISSSSSYQLTKFEDPSCYSFGDIINTNFRSPNLQREIIRKK